MTDIATLRSKSPDELKEMTLSLKKELFNLRFQVASGEQKNTARFREVRRDIARAKTLLNERGVAQPAKKTAKPAKEAKAQAKPAKEAKAAKPKKKAE